MIYVDNRQEKIKVDDELEEQLKNNKVILEAKQQEY